MQENQLQLSAGALPPEGWNRVVEALAATLASTTWAIYASHWRHWNRWCASNGAPVLPTTPEHLAMYLTKRAEKHAINTIRTAAAAIGAYHAHAGHDNPAQHEGVKMTLRGLARQYRRRPRQVKGLTALNLASISATAHIPRYREGEAEARLRGITDLAMIGLMRDSLLRRSETAELTWDDLEKERDGSGRIYIAHSKTDQEGEGAVGYVSPQTMVTQVGKQERAR